ncbi:MAG: hypothetical protein U1E27_02670, partial [Kiritimatiellia bacterium]|nr:hypothetical protein [Kiritimatiellia bacterium]
MRGSAVTGVAWRNAAGIEWTTLRVNPGGRTDASPVKTESADFTPADRPTSLHAACRRMGGRVSLALPSSDMLLRVWSLPPSAPEEIGGMIELQIDKISPFPIEEMTIAWEV